MKKRSKAPARVLALLALIGAVVAIVAVVQGVTGDDGSTKRNRPAKQAKQVKKQKEEPKTPKVYVVESGDNLTAIAQKTGVPVAEIEQLNPTVDPLSLVEGEELKLR